MYEVVAPRSPHAAIAALVPQGAPYSVHRLLDAMLVLPQFGDPRMPRKSSRNRFGSSAWRPASIARV